MKVTVYHQKFNEITGRPVVENGIPMFDAVAEVEAPEGQGGHDALEYAYRWTNNIAGSWSLGKTHYDDGSENGDYNPNVKVLLPNPVYNGRVFGQRSSMVGDVFAVGNQTFVVAAFGFEPYNN